MTNILRDEFNTNKRTWITTVSQRILKVGVWIQQRIHFLSGLATHPTLEFFKLGMMIRVEHCWVREAALQSAAWGGRGDDSGSSSGGQREARTT
jgi:hypothetical protein